MTSGEGQAEAFRLWLSSAGAVGKIRTWGASPDEHDLARDFRFGVCRGPQDTLVLIGEPQSTDDLASALRDLNEGLVHEHRRMDRDRERLDRAAQQDALTGVANRRAFDDRLSREVELAANGGGFALVMLDIDHFK